MDPTADVPDFLDEPLDNLDARLQRMEQVHQLQQLQQLTAADEQRFASEHPDYYDALNHVRGRLREQLLVAGYGENQVDAELAQRELAAAAEVLQRGGRPSEYAYTLAKQHGYAGGSQYDGEMDRYAEMESQHAAEDEHLNAMMSELQEELTPSDVPAERLVPHWSE